MKKIYQQFEACGPQPIPLKIQAWSWILPLHRERLKLEFTERERERARQWSGFPAISNLYVRKRGKGEIVNKTVVKLW